MLAGQGLSPNFVNNLSELINFYIVESPRPAHPEIYLERGGFKRGW